MCVYLGLITGVIDVLKALDNWDELETEGIVTGFIVLGLAVLFTILAQTPLRRWNFTLFLQLHQIGFVLIVIAALMHGMVITVICGGVFMVDCCIRGYYLYVNKKNASTASLKLLEDNIVEISVQKNKIQYRAGSYFFVCLPELSLYEWHPFSVSSSPYQDKITFHVKVLGDWTQKLYDWVNKDNIG